MNEAENRMKVKCEAELLNYYRFSGSNSIAGGEFSAHGTSLECSRFSRCSPDVMKPPRGCKRAARCAPTFCEAVAR